MCKAVAFGRRYWLTSGPAYSAAGQLGCKCDSPTLKVAAILWHLEVGTPLGYLIFSIDASGDDESFECCFKEGCQYHYLVVSFVAKRNVKAWLRVNR